VLLSLWWVKWQRSLIVVQPPTVLRWRRRGFWGIWVSGSCGRWRGGRPRISGEVRALIVRMSQENFLWGAPRIHGELLKLGFEVSQATVSRYMPGRGYPPTQTWRTFLRNQAFGIVKIGLDEAIRVSDESLVRGWIARVVRRVTKARDGIPCRRSKPSSTLHRLRPYCSSNRTDRRAVRGRCMPVPPWPTILGGENWTMPGRRLSSYRSRASPRRRLPALTNLTIAIAHKRQANHNSHNAIVLHVCHEQPAQKTDHPQYPSPSWRRFCESAIADKVMRNDRSPETENEALPNRRAHVGKVIDAGANDYNRFYTPTSLDGDGPRRRRTSDRDTQSALISPSARRWHSPSAP
jgi:hypothetical protein